MTAVVRGDALHIPLRDKSVNLIVTSPPYFALRSYRDDGKHYDGQIGSEPDPQAFLEALWAVTKECWRVLADDGVMFVNLGDKRSGSGGHNNSGIKGARSLSSGEASASGLSAAPAPLGARPATRRNAPDRYNQAAFGRPKSKMALPHRYFIGCMDGLADPDGIGWIARQDIVWNKPNGLPESVTDRVRDSHEYWFMLTKQERYFAAVDEVREPYKPKTYTTVNSGFDSASANYESDHAGHRKNAWARDHDVVRGDTMNLRGALPGSVWTIASEPLVVPEWLGVDHFAAFPQEWPRRLILGWSPSGICTACGQGRRPVVDKQDTSTRSNGTRNAIRRAEGEAKGTFQSTPLSIASGIRTEQTATITGYTCACPTPNAPTRPAVVLDPFGGTGTTAMVARALGRTGISLDLSADYCRLAQWRIFESGHAAKARERTNREAQGSLL